jgi:hypothetical protein
MFKPTPSPDGPVMITGACAEQLRLTFSALDSQAERQARLAVLLDLTDAVAGALTEGPAAEYRAVAAQAKDLAARHTAALEAVTRLQEQHASATKDSSPGLGDRLVALERSLTGAKREVDLFAEQLQAVYKELRSARAAAEAHIQSAGRLQLERKRSIDAEVGEILSGIIKAVGAKLARLMDLSAASNSLAAFDAIAVTKGLAQRLLGPIPQPPAKPPVEPITGPRNVPGLGRIGYVSGNASADDMVKSLNASLTTAYKDRLQPDEKK